MHNQKMFKKVFVKEFDQKKIYNEILENYSKKNQYFFKNLKWLLVPLGLTFILGYSLLNHDNINLQNFSAKYLSNTSKNNIYINKIEDQAILKLDVDAKIANELSLPSYFSLSSLVIPQNLTLTDTYALYTKKEMKGYSILNNYIIIYSNAQTNQSINISFSDKYKPLKDYYFLSDNTIPSVINNISLFIYNCNQTYFTEFTYNNINYDIETTNITLEDFINLIASLIT